MDRFPGFFQLLRRSSWPLQSFKKQFAPLSYLFFQRENSHREWRLETLNLSDHLIPGYLQTLQNQALDSCSVAPVLPPLYLNCQWWHKQRLSCRCCGR